MLVAFWMVQRLTRELNELQKQMLDKQIELEHLSKYSGRLGASNNMSITNIAGLSAEILPRASLFAEYADNASSMSAAQNLQMMNMMGRVPITGNQIMDMQIQMSAYSQFKQESLKALKQQEVNYINEKEKEMQLEMNSIKQRYEMKKSQLDEYKQLAQAGVKDAAPHLT